MASRHGQNSLKAVCAVCSCAPALASQPRKGPGRNLSRVPAQCLGGHTALPRWETELSWLFPGQQRRHGSSVTLAPPGARKRSGSSVTLHPYFLRLCWLFFPGKESMTAQALGPGAASPAVLMVILPKGKITCRQSCIKIPWRFSGVFVRQ